MCIRDSGNYASGAGIADKVLLTEDAESVAAQTYGNVICVKEGNENDPAVQALVAVVMSQDVQDWISANYSGVVMPMGAQDLEIPEISEPVTLTVGASPSPHAEILELSLIHICPQPLLYKRNCRRVHGDHLQTHRGRHGRRGLPLQGLSVLRADAHPGRPLSLIHI